MKRIFTILVITIFSTLSCSEYKSRAKNSDKIEIENGNKTDIQNAKLETSDTVASNNSSDHESKLSYFKDLDLFYIRDLEEENKQNKVGFISLSDIYSLSEHPDSLAIPSLENVDNQNLQYFKLNSIYRKRFLSKTNISEKDSVFIYDYSTDALLSFSVKKLNVVAYLNIYMDIKDCPCRQYDYMIGFEVEKSNLNGLGKYYSDALVFIGKENPFTQGQMKPIVWKKISSNEFPILKSNQKNAINSEKMGNSYAYKSDKYYYFINDYKVKLQESGSNYENSNRHLMIIDIKTGKLVIERLFAETESTSPSILNFGISQPDNPDLTDMKSQWTGKLFKNHAEVVFGFENVSFGCPNIIFIDPHKEDIYLNCDNRH